MSPALLRGFEWREGDSQAAINIHPDSGLSLNTKRVTFCNPRLSSAISMQISRGGGVWSVFIPDPRQWNETTHSGVETLFAGIGLIHRSFELISMFGKTVYAVRIEPSYRGCELSENAPQCSRCWVQELWSHYLFSGEQWARRSDWRSWELVRRLFTVTQFLVIVILTPETITMRRRLLRRLQRTLPAWWRVWEDPWSPDITVCLVVTFPRCVSPPSPLSMLARSSLRDGNLCPGPGCSHGVTRALSSHLLSHFSSLSSALGTLLSIVARCNNQVQACNLLFMTKCIYDLLTV